MGWSHNVTVSGRTVASQEGMPPAKPFDLFPTRIWQVSLNRFSSRFAEWVATIEALRAAAPIPAGRTNRGGWNSTDNAVLHQPIFGELHKTIRDYCLQAFNEMGLASPAFALQSWANIHDRGGFNFQHMHEGALLCGTFYLQVPEGSGALVFKDPRPGVHNSYAKGSGANAFKDIQLHPSAGLLVLFPHWLEHFVEPHGNDTPRICIPFNALPP